MKPTESKSSEGEKAEEKTKAPARSGGLTARNTRQGFRSEYIVKYIFSAFGTAVDVSSENDLGIDLLCNLTSFEGLVIIYKSSYGIQVKSTDKKKPGSEFQFEGKQATTWLSKLEFPLLLVEVDKDHSRVKVYSTWNLNRYLLGLHSDIEDSFPTGVHFKKSDDGNPLEDPIVADGIATIPVGKPILDFHYHDIDNPEKLELYHKVLEEWLDIDNENYKLRRAGISRTYGFTTWNTNELPSSFHVWNLVYYYSPFHANKTKKILTEALVALGVHNKNNHRLTPNDSFKHEFNAIRAFIGTHLSGYLDDWGKGVFDAELS